MSSQSVTVFSSRCFVMGVNNGYSSASVLKSRIEFLSTESDSYITTDGQSASLYWNKAPIWGLRPDFYYCQTVAGLLIWDAFYGERTGLSFAIAAGARQRSHSRAGSRWTRDHILLSQIRDFPLRRLQRLAGLRWRYSTPPPHGILSTELDCSFLTPRHEPHRKHPSSHCNLLLCGSRFLWNVFTEPLLTNGSDISLFCRSLPGNGSIRHNMNGSTAVFHWLGIFC
jgi:hypothetical protein